MHMWNRRSHQDRGGRSKCGKISQDTQLSDLAFTQNGKYPWIGVINFGSNNGSRPGDCASTLVAANWIVTAAHCVSKASKATMSVVLGEYNISSSTDSWDTKR